MTWGLPALIYALLLLGAFGLGCVTLGHVCVLSRLFGERRRRRRVRGVSSSFTPPISILKPLKGVDDELLANLSSLAEQDYPCFEILIAVEDPKDPALGPARELQRRYPLLPIRLVIRRNPIGRNPKVNNLLSALPLARYEHLLISDSNVCVERDYLRAVVAPLADPEVGLVSNLIAGSGERTLGATLENLHLNTFVVSGVCAGAALDHPIVVGKSMLMRRRDLERVGGLWSVRDVLAEDYVLGRAFHDAGMRVVLASHAIRSINRDWSVRQFLSRHLRWGQLRRFGHPLGFALEPALYPIPFLLAAALLQLSAHGPGGLVNAACAGIVVKIGLDGLVLRCLGAPVRGRALLLVPLKDLLTLSLWPIALLRRDVVWRGNRLRLGPGTRLLDRPPAMTGSGPLSGRHGVSGLLG